MPATIIKIIHATAAKRILRAMILSNFNVRLVESGMGVGDVASEPRGTEGWVGDGSKEPKVRRSEAEVGSDLSGVGVGMGVLVGKKVGVGVDGLVGMGEGAGHVFALL